MLFLFHIDYTIYAIHVLIKTKQSLPRDIELIIKYRVVWIPLVPTVFALSTCSREVKVVQSGQSRDRFRILIIANTHKSDNNQLIKNYKVISLYL